MAVGNDDIGLVERDHFGGPPVDLHHLANVSGNGVVLDPVAHLKGMLGMDRQAGKDIAQRVFEGKSQHGRDQRRSRYQLPCVDPRLPQDHQQGQRKHQAAEHIEKDLGHRSRHPLPHRHRPDQQQRLQQRGDQKKLQHVMGMGAGLCRRGRHTGRKHNLGQQRQQPQPQQHDRHPREPASALGGRG